ncbi:nuclear transport factor 2 family protein [Azohydromonas australica]|uniref:nuclear transport factor 2 family protein n=1 Tax=Azohydromonas australica TaxID=364039 RepID=UPI0005BD8B0B|nr:nuclear transport factor 2 family protein [Azohydromonas australica]
MNQALVETLLSLEQQRCDAIVRQDWSALSALLSSRLVHTHTRGNTDTRESYLDYISRVIETLDVQREELRVIPLGEDAAMLLGRQTNRARRRGQAEEVQVQSAVTQVWAREEDGKWRMVAFHASALGALPPAVSR